MPWSQERGSKARMWSPAADEGVGRNTHRQVCEKEKRGAGERLSRLEHVMFLQRTWVLPLSWWGTEKKK